jgi:hypothetical protein
MPRPKGGTLTEDHIAAISDGTLQRHAREREQLARSMQDIEPEALMAGVLRGIRNGALPPRVIRVILDLGCDQEAG